MLHTLALFLSTIAFFAQLDVASNQTSSPTESRVDQVLREWSDHSSKVRSLYAEFTRTKIDHAWHDKEIAEGSARYVSPGMARLDILGDDALSYIITAKGEFHEYRVPMRKVTVYEWNDWNANDRDLWIRRNPSALFLLFDHEAAVANYTFEIVGDADDAIHLRLKPRTSATRREVAMVEIWLNRQRNLPSRVSVREPNQDQIEYAFHGIWTDIEINPDDFVPKVPANAVGEPEWQVIRQKTAGQTKESHQPNIERSEDHLSIGCGDD